MKRTVAAAFLAGTVLADDTGKVRVPGIEENTPVVWGDRIYLTSSIPPDRRVPEERPVPAEDPRGQQRDVTHPEPFFAFDDGFDASPAVSGDDLFPGGKAFLHRIAEP